MLIKYFFKGRPSLGLFLFLFNIIFSNSFNSINISSIEIEGNSKTQDYIVKREIRHLINTKLDSNIINEDIMRLENLGIFSGVSWSVESLNDGNFFGYVASRWGHHRP